MKMRGLTYKVDQLEEEMGIDIPELLKELLQAGFDSVQIAEKLEVSPQTVCNWIRDLGMIDLMNHSKKKYRYDCRLMSKKEISEASGIPYSTVKRYIKSNGIKHGEVVDITKPGAVSYLFLGKQCTVKELAKMKMMCNGGMYLRIKRAKIKPGQDVSECMI